MPRVSRFDFCVNSLSCNYDPYFGNLYTVKLRGSSMGVAHQDAADFRTSFGDFDAVVLGAGISGLVSASILSTGGERRILVVDEYDHVGGNHIDWSVDGYTFDVGSLIFQDDSPLLAHFPEMAPLYVPIDPRWARLTPQGIVTTYPISLRDDVFGTGPLEILRIFSSALYARLFQRRMRNAEEFARHWIGAHLLRRSGLGSYMKRFYGVPAEEIDIELAQKRMLWISEHASVRNLLSRLLKPKSGGPTNRQLARPREGFRPLYAAAVERLERRGVTFVLGSRMHHIRRADGKFELCFDDTTISTDRVVSTIPIHRAEELCGIKTNQRLESITLVSLYFSFAGDRGFDESIIYNFSHEGSWKRLTVYSDFYGRVRGREYFGVEVIADRVDGAEAAFREHVGRNGLFRGDLKLEGSQTLENAYPIYRRGASKAAGEAIAALRMFGIESFGRQGGFNYQPTARSSTVEAEIALGAARSD